MSQISQISQISPQYDIASGFFAKMACQADVPLGQKGSSGLNTQDRVSDAAGLLQPLA